jgi:hypothetical protein
LNTWKYGSFDDIVGATETFFDFYLNVKCFVQMFEVLDKKNHFYTFADAFIRRVNPIKLKVYIEFNLKPSNYCGKLVKRIQKSLLLLMQSEF